MIKPIRSSLSTRLTPILFPCVIYAQVEQEICRVPPWPTWGRNRLRPSRPRAYSGRAYAARYRSTRLTTREEGIIYIQKKKKKGRNIPPRNGAITTFPLSPRLLPSHITPYEQCVLPRARNDRPALCLSSRAIPYVMGARHRQMCETENRQHPECSTLRPSYECNADVCTPLWAYVETSCTGMGSEAW